MGLNHLWFACSLWRLVSLSVMLVAFCGKKVLQAHVTRRKCQQQRAFPS